MNYWLIILAGLTTGGISCAAMQGGLLASVIATGKTDELEHPSSTTQPTSFDFLDWAPVSAFLIAKLVAHTILGFGLGWLGSKLEISLGARLTFQIAAALFMLTAAANLLDIHPFFRRFTLTPPRFARKFIRSTTRNRALFAPALLGFLTIFIPCGVTQAMEVLAINSANPIQGALIMGAFVLGTVPVFAGIGLATAKLSELWSKRFLQVAAAAIVLMALSSINGVLVVLDSPLAANRLGPTIVRALPPYNKTSSRSYVQDPNVILEDGVQKITLAINNQGYSPRKFSVRVGVPVELTLETNGGVYSCATAFTFRSFKIYDNLGPNDSSVHTFTPTKKGKFTFACSMGMYSGVMEVI